MSAVILDLMPKIAARKAVEALLKKAEADRLEAQKAIQDYLNAFINDNSYTIESNEIDYSIDFGDEQ